MTQNKIEKQPEEITICFLEVLVMPNGEVICKVKSLGWFDEFKKFLYNKNHNIEK